MKTVKSRFTSLYCVWLVNTEFPVVWWSTIAVSLRRCDWLFPPSAREVSPGNRSNYKSTRERVGSKGLYGRWRLHLMGSCLTCTFFFSDFSCYSLFIWWLEFSLKGTKWELRAYQRWYLITSSGLEFHHLLRWDVSYRDVFCKATVNNPTLKKFGIAFTAGEKR